MDQLVVALPFLFVMHYTAHLLLPCGGEVRQGGLRGRLYGFRGRQGARLQCNDSRDVGCASAFGVLTTLAACLESLHLRLLVSLFTHLVCLFVVVVAPPCRGRPMPGSSGWAQGKSVEVWGGPERLGKVLISSGRLGMSVGGQGEDK